MPKYEIYGHKFESDHYLSAEEAQQLKDRFAPPLSAKEPKEEGGHPYLATAARVGLPIVGSAAGLVAGPPGAAIGGAIGGAAGTYLGGKLEGREPSGAEYLVNTVFGGVGPAGRAGTVLQGAKQFAKFGAVSSSLDALARGESLPEIGMAALTGATVGGATGGVVTKLTLRTHLGEIFSPDVADEAHSILTKGKTSNPNIPASLKEEIADIGRAQRQLRFGFEPVEVPGVSMSEVSDVRPRRYVPKGEKGRFAKPLGEGKQLGLEGVPPTPGQEKKLTLRIRAGEQLDPISIPQKSYDAEAFKFRGKIPEAEPEAPPVRPDVKGGTTLFRVGLPKIWVYDKMQRQTGIPVYDEVYRPIREAVESGNDDAIEKAVKQAKELYSKNKEMPGPVRRLVDHTIKMAEGHKDGFARDVQMAIKDWTRRLPLFGREISDETAARWASHVIGLQYAGTLAGRPGPMIRNMAQSFQTGYMFLGERWYARGLKDALSSRGYNEAVSLGALGSEHSLLTSEMIPEGRFYSRALRWGFGAYQKIDDFNRATIFLGQYRKALDAARKAGANVDDFITRAGLYVGVPQSETAQIAKLYQAGKVQEAARRAGIARADATQFLYSNLERPEAVSSSAGRLLGGFYNWPAFYGALLKQTAGDIMTGPAPATQKAAVGARFLVANGLLMGTSYKIYKETGSKNPGQRAAGWTGLAPISYGGGAAMESLVQGGRASYHLLTRPPTEKNLKSSAVEAYRAGKPLVPFSGLLEDAIWSGQKVKKTLEDR